MFGLVRLTAAVHKLSALPPFEGGGSGRVLAQDGIQEEA